MMRGGGGDSMGVQMRVAAGGGGGGGIQQHPQWGPQETRELIGIRGELEREGGSSSSRGSNMWEAVSAAMWSRGGYLRTPEQCKCKWKNLVNRYKGKETSDPENGRQCPFFEELQAVFTERARNMQRQLLKSESGASAKKKLKRSKSDRSSEEVSDDEEDNDEDSEDEQPSRNRKRKADDRRQQQQRTMEKSRGSTSSIHDLLQDILQQQQRMDLQWQERIERREHERLMFEQDWRQTMEKLERERLMLEQDWMEREEQRKIREEVRAEKRDVLLNSLLNKLLQDDLL